MPVRRKDYQENYTKNKKKLPGNIEIALEAGESLQCAAGVDDETQQEEQKSNNDIGDDLEGRARHGAILMQTRMHTGVVTRHGAQFLLDAVGVGNGRGTFFHLRDISLLLLVTMGSGGMLLGGGSRYSPLLLLLFCLVEGGSQVGAAIGTEADAWWQLLTATVAEP